MTVNTNTRIVRAKFIAPGETLSTANFKTETVKVDTNLNEGEILIRNIYLALDPYTRFSFQEGGPSSKLNETVSGLGVGEVVQSKNNSYPVKSIVLGLGIGWEQYTLLKNPQGLWVIPDAHNPKVPLAEYVNALGINGLTAWAAAETLVKFKKDQVIYVSSAAGPVGSFFSILAKRQGAFVIGSAGSDEKVSYLVNDLGLDAAFNYKTKDTRAELDAIAPKGLDLYFDLVGGETFDIALEKLKPNAQVVAIGNISTFGSKTPYAVKNLNLIVAKALHIDGFTAFHHLQRFPDLWKEYAPLIANKEIKSQKQNIIEGVESSSQAFVDYMDGKYHGKVIIQVGSL
ncbi:hypothetical protein BGZ76_003747, partial [Entomortierella beljakovae]